MDNVIAQSLLNMAINGIPNSCMSEHKKNLIAIRDWLKAAPATQLSAAAPAATPTPLYNYKVTWTRSRPVEDSKSADTPSQKFHPRQEKKMAVECVDCGLDRIDLYPWGTEGSKLYDDPRNPPLEEVPCLCRGCYIAALESCVEICEEEAEGYREELRKVDPDWIDRQEEDDDE